MSERKPQTKHIPLRVHLRPTTKNHSYGREQNIPINGILSSIQPTAAEFIYVSGTERRARLIKELLCLCNLLRTDLSLDDILQQIASSIITCTGFRGSAINLLDESEEMLHVFATVGVTEDDQPLLHEKPFPVDILFNLMRPQFRISQSYFIPHEDFSLLADATVVMMKDGDREKRESGLWHAEDFLLVPLYSPRGQHYSAVFHDDPEDNKISTIESIEILELFADKAAMAIDNARLFHEHEQERMDFEQAIGFPV